ncbi:MAG: hypothetical protein HPY83_00150 [Anaerolineae bacterium]|nr:hypothetical protein [Anaerolineae bacterium]
MTRAVLIFGLVVTCLALGATPALAEGSITLNAPATTLGNGDDFATTILGDPWDMDKLQDIGWEENVSSISVADGVWSGRVTVTNPAAGVSGYVFPLFQGFAGAWPVGQIGANYPIDTSRYTQLSYRMYVSDRSNGNHAVYWTHEVDWPDGSDFFARADTTPNGWKIYSFDMTADNGQGTHQSGSWQSGPVYGLRIDPNPARSDYDLKVDWVRLTDPSTSPRYTITWNFSGLSDTSAAQIYVDTDAQGYDGDAVASVLVGQRRYELPTCILPGGDYYLYLRSGDVVSNYGQRLRINNPPTLRWDLTAMGQDYATTELGNPWDMSDRTDLTNLGDVFLNDPELYGLRQLYDWRFEDGVFSATADSNFAFENYSPLKQSDVQLWPNIDSGRPVDTGRYRYLVVRIKVDDPLNRTRSELVQDGWIGRVVWWNQDIGVDGFVTDEIVYHKGWNTYVIDLAARDRPAGYDPGRPMPPWRDMGTVRYMRYDPLEVSTDTRFHVDEMRLLSQPTADQILRLYLGVGDSDGQPLDLTYYYDTDGAGFDGIPLMPVSGAWAGAQAVEQEGVAGRRTYLPIVPQRAAVGLSPIPEDSGLTLREVSLRMGSVPRGTYFIYACASDGIAETCHYLPVPVTVSHP